MQESIIIDDFDASQRLNKKLSEGWVVVHTCPMPSSCSCCGGYERHYVFNPTCLVIIEK